MGMREMPRSSVTAASGPTTFETVEIFTRPHTGARWEFCSDVEVSSDAGADLTAWLSNWLADNHISVGQWLAGNKWSGQDSAILTAAHTVAA